MWPAVVGGTTVVIASSRMIAVSVQFVLSLEIILLIGVGVELACRNK